MAGILSIALSSMNAYQRALDVTGNNIANMYTPSYTRQSAWLSPRQTDFYGGSYIGTGVLVENIRRHADEFANKDVRDTLSIKSQYDAFYKQALQVDKLLSAEGTSIAKTMQDFFTSLGQLNDAPQSMSARGVAMKQSQLLVDQFRGLQTRLDESQRNTSMQVGEAVKQVNQLSTQIAEMNNELLKAPGALDLLDKRDELIRQLAQFTDVQTVTQGDGSVNVSIGTGEMLVVGATARAMSVISAPGEQSGLRIGLGNGAGTVDVTNSMQSGSIGGLLQYEKNVLIPASQQLGQMAIGMAQQFNAQHRLGMNLNNQLGGDFFTDFNSANMQADRVAAGTANTGTGNITVSISDIGAIQISDYDLVVSDTGTNEIRLIRRSDGQSTTVNWSQTPPAPPAGEFTLDGMTVHVDDVGNLVNNDRYTLSPTRGAAGSMAIQLTDARDFALASPVRASANLSNLGTGKVRLDSLTSTADVNKTFRIEFLSGNQYQIVNVTDSVTTGPFAFTPNSDNTIAIPNIGSPSYTLNLSGAPQAGDQFTAEFNTGGFGDNRNGLSMAAIQNQKILTGGTETLSDFYANLITQTGSKTYQAKTRAEAADILHKQAVDFRESQSGVNLDEELANLMVYQQSYQAAGQLLAVSSQLMDVLFSVMR